MRVRIQPETVFHENKKIGQSIEKNVKLLLIVGVFGLFGFKGKKSLDFSLENFHILWYSVLKTYVVFVLTKTPNRNIILVINHHNHFRMSGSKNGFPIFLFFLESYKMDPLFAWVWSALTRYQCLTGKKNIMRSLTVGNSRLGQINLT